MPPLSVPTSSALPPAQRLPSSSPAVFRILNRLSRQTLLSLVLDWLDGRNQGLCAPYLQEDEEDEDVESDLYPPAQSLEELREYYTELQGQKGSRKDVVDRIIEGDWRNGVSLYQLAMADMQYLYDHPSAQRWTSFKVVQHSNSSADSKTTELPSMPRFHPPTFLENLQKETLPDVKVHYNLDSPAHLPLTILRIFLLSSPYNTSLALRDGTKSQSADGTRTVYIAFPTASPHVFFSLQANNQVVGVTTQADTKSLRALLQNAIPKAFSRPQERYSLVSSSYTARTLDALLARRGQGRSNAAGGGWSTYAQEKTKDGKAIKDTPLDQHLPTPPPSGIEDELETTKSLPLTSRFKRKSTNLSAEASKRLKANAQARFGGSGNADDKEGIERLDIRLEDPYPLMLPSNPSAPAAVHLKTQQAGIEKTQKGRISAIEAEFLAAHSHTTSEDDLEEDRGWIPDVRMTFHGNHVFAGIREMVECGIIDGKRMPGWLTGEEGVSIGVVKDGRILGFKGSRI